MKERPISFSDAMALAAFNGSKTQTRRTLRCRAPKWHDHDFHCIEMREHGGIIWPHTCFNDGGGRLEKSKMPCPYGAVGDRLWVRESYYQFGHWEPVTNAKTEGGKQKWKFVPDCREIRFENPAGSELRLGRHSKDSESMAWHKRLARFMPRSACRNVLKITGIRVERLRDITENDARAEGAQFHDGRPTEHHGWRYDRNHGYVYPTARDSFVNLWDTINGPASWDENPWVWVIETKRVEVSK